MNQRKLLRHRLVTYHNVMEVTCSEPTLSVHRRACHHADTLSDCRWDLPTPHRYRTRPDSNYSLSWRTVRTDRTYINPTPQVRLTFMHSLIYPFLIQMHILKKQEGNLLYLKCWFPWKACLQMGLLQVLKASEKKGTILCTFKSTTPFVTLFSWPPLWPRTRN